MPSKINLINVVIIGGGGLYAAKALGRVVSVTLVDKRNFHLFQPLSQVATGTLSPLIFHPLRSVLNSSKNTKVLMAEVIDINPEQRKVILLKPTYDSLIIATGVSHHLLWQ